MRDKLFLVTGVVSKECYESNETRLVRQETRLVWSTDEVDAKYKFKTFFESKSSEYSIYYTVYNIVAEEAIS